MPCLPTSQSNAFLAVSNVWRRDTSHSSSGTSSSVRGSNRLSPNALCRSLQNWNSYLYRAYFFRLSRVIGIKQPMQPRRSRLFLWTFFNVTKIPLQWKEQRSAYYFCATSNSGAAKGYPVNLFRITSKQYIIISFFTTDMDHFQIEKKYVRVGKSQKGGTQNKIVYRSQSCSDIESVWAIAKCTKVERACLDGGILFFQLHISQNGLISTSVRKEAWLLLIGEDPDQILTCPSVNIANEWVVDYEEAIRDYSQINVDIQRSFVYYNIIRSSIDILTDTRKSLLNYCVSLHDSRS